MTIDEIVQTFINDLKKTKEYKEAWRNCEETKDIVFNFKDKLFFNLQDYPNHRPCINEIVMDEEILLGR